uniref:Uncharacterized protein n=3 Tax=Meloidogyne TaxID=189290 RepID=A0A914LKB7_MELIC
MRVESNYEVDILSRLGILERETPNDIITTKIKSNRFVDKKRKFHRVSLNVALNKISLSESSTDEDKDFINKKLSSETKKDQTIFYSSNNNCHSNPNFCEFISLLSAAGFLGFSLTLKESNFETNFDGINILINSIFILLGSYFATFCLFKFNLNSFFLLLSVMLTFVTVFALFLIDKSEKILNFGYLNIILFNASQSFLIATIERVILLIIPRWKINFGRVIFIVYSFIAFCAFLSSSLQINLEKNNLLNNSEINEKQTKILNKTENFLEEFIFIKYLFFNEFLFILLIFVLPILFGFCCFLGQPLGSPQQKISKNNYFNELQVSSSFICQILLFFIMTLHFTSSFIAQHSIYFNNENNFENIQNVLFWLFLLIFRLPFVFWPELSIRLNLFYFLYFILITANILLKLIIPEHFSNIFDLAILSFSSNFPLFLYVWYINYSKCSHLDISFCYILSFSFGELIGKFIFWKQNISPSLSLKIGLFSIAFLLFLILFFKIQKEGRQRQIIEYKSSINGKGNTQNSSKTKRKLKKKVKTSKGAYSLLEMNRRIANKNNTEKQQKTLISSNDDRSSFDSEDDEDEADVEMESVTGDYDEELEKEECTKINELL